MILETALNLNKRKRKMRSMSIFSPDDYRRDAERSRKADRPKKAHWEVKHRYSAKSQRWKYWCPNLCQQNEKGSKGKKTFDGKICKACGYEKKVSGS